MDQPAEPSEDVGQKRIVLAHRLEKMPWRAVCQGRENFPDLRGIFLFAYFLPLGNVKVQDAVLEAFKMLQAYARNHTLTCVVPALVMDGEVKVAGKAPTIEDIKKMLQ